MPVAMVWIWFLTFLLKINTNITRLETGNKFIAGAPFKTLKGYPGERFALIRTNFKSLCIKLGDVGGFAVSEARLTVRAYASN